MKTKVSEGKDNGKEGRMAGRLREGEREKEEIKGAAEWMRRD